MAANDFTLEELEALFQEEEQETPPAQMNEGTPTAPAPEIPNNLKGKEGAKIVANRINAERKAIAEKMGYTSYEEMLKSHAEKVEAEKKAKEEQLIKDKGFDPAEIKAIYEELIKNDPRMKELEAFRKKQVEEYGLKQLAEITKLTGGAITKLEQLPQNVIDLWAKNGDLKAAYLQLEGEKLIMQARSSQSKGTTQHLQNPSGTNPPPPATRPLTDEEKLVWKQFHPNLTEEELNKKTMPL